MTVTVAVNVPETILTAMLVGDKAATPLFRVKLMVPGRAPLAGVTVNDPGGTPAVVIVDVYVPEPASALVPVWPHSRVCVVGVAVNAVGGTVGGSASPAGPRTPITKGVSITRFCASVTMSAAEPQPPEVVTR